MAKREAAWSRKSSRPADRTGASSRPQLLIKDRLREAAHKARGQAVRSRIGRHQVPRYLFDFIDGSREPDRVGTELPSHDDAEREAIRFLGEVLKGEPERLRADTLRVHVRNDDAGYQCVVVADIKRPDR